MGKIISDIEKGLFNMACHYAGIKINYHGTKNLDILTSPTLLCSNHASILDGPALVIGAKKKLYKMKKEGKILQNDEWRLHPNTIVKEEAWRHSIVGFALDNVKCIPLDRKGISRSDIEKYLNILKYENLMIFPQGSRTNKLDGGGVYTGLIAHISQVPIIPIYVQGTNNAVPKSKDFSYLILKNKKRKEVNIYFGNPTKISLDFEKDLDSLIYMANIKGNKIPRIKKQYRKDLQKAVDEQIYDRIKYLAATHNRKNLY